jgi:outer membrane protein OmpA-like peptidoglycan-associated protein
MNQHPLTMNMPITTKATAATTVTTISAAIFLLLSTTGCVSPKKMTTYVDDQIASVDTRVDDVESQVEANQERIEQQAEAQKRQEEELAKLSTTSRQALERAIAAGHLAEGKLLYETILSEEDVRFGFESANLDAQSKAALDAFATGLKSNNKGIYLEIQGHTDSLGTEEFNFKLGQKRAEAVQRYLHLNHALPLHRMSAISYGETAPRVENDSRQGRGQNRRVALVVLK